MSNQQIAIAARRVWLESESAESYAVWIAKQKLSGNFWGADDE